MVNNKKSNYTHLTQLGNTPSPQATPAGDHPQEVSDFADSRILSIAKTTTPRWPTLKHTASAK